MPTYMVMSKWTSQGLQNVKQSAARLDAARKAYDAAGASDHVKLIFEEHTGHQITAKALEEIEAWLVQWLRH